MNKNNIIIKNIFFGVIFFLFIIAEASLFRGVGALFIFPWSAIFLFFTFFFFSLSPLAVLWAGFLTDIFSSYFFGFFALLYFILWLGFGVLGKIFRKKTFLFFLASVILFFSGYFLLVKLYEYVF